MAQSLHRVYVLKLEQKHFCFNTNTEKIKKIYSRDKTGDDKGKIISKKDKFQELLVFLVGHSFQFYSAYVLYT